MSRPKSSLTNGKQTAFRLPSELYDMLEKEAAKKEISVGEEIRQRLWWSLAESPAIQHLYIAEARFNLQQYWMTNSGPKNG